MVSSEDKLEELTNGKKNNTAVNVTNRQQQKTLAVETRLKIWESSQTKKLGFREVTDLYHTTTTQQSFGMTPSYTPANAPWTPREQVYYTGEPLTLR